MNLSKELIFFLQGSAGAISGYITNKYAVNMLFKEYMPFKIFNKTILPVKFGGVIKNRKEEFIEEISELVERDIINSNTILSNINEKEFEKALNNVIMKFFNDELKKALHGITFDNIQNFDYISENLIKTFITALKENTNIFSIFIEDITTNKTLNSKIIHDICVQIFDILEKEIIQKDFLEKSIQELLKNISNEEIGLIINNNSFENIERIITALIKNSTNSIISDNQRLSEIIDNIFNKLDFKPALEKIQKDIYLKKINDYFTEEDYKTVSNKIFEAICSYINSEDGKNNINIVYSYIISLIKNLNYTIYDILPYDIGENLTKLIDTSIHKILPYFSAWIDKNKNEFDYIIEESIDEAIGTLDSGIKKMIISKVRELFLDNISAKNEIVEKITKYINSYNIDENSLDEICASILNYLRHTKISDMVTNIENNYISENKLLENIDIFIRKYFKENGQEIIYNLLRKQGEKTFKEIFKIDLIELFYNKIKPFIINLILKNKIKLEDGLTKIISKKLKSLKNHRLKDFISESIISNNINEITVFIRNILEKNKNSILDNMESYCVGVLDNLQFSPQIEDAIVLEICNLIKNKTYEQKKVSIYNCINKSLCNDKVYKSVSKYASNLIKNNLNTLLKGKVKEIIKNNLKQYDEDEICDLAQKFMGNELKPLSVFGGILGFICGIIFGLFSQNIGLNGFYGNITDQVLSIILMGVIGVLTNVIAINMLFKPYTKNKFLAKIPFLKNFALGYIPSHKENISKGIGKVIDDDLLNKNYISTILNRHKDTLKNKLFITLSYDNFKIIRNVMNSNKDKINKIINSKLIKLVSNNKTDFIVNIKEYISKIKINPNVLKRESIKKVIQNLEIEHKIEKSLMQYIIELNREDIQINDIIPEKFKYEIENYTDTLINKEIKAQYLRLQEYKIKSSISFYTSEILNDEKTLILISEKTTEFIKENGLVSLVNFIENNITNIADSMMKDNNTIGTIFDGKVKTYLDKNLYNLTVFTVEKIKLILIKNKDLIKTAVKEKINESLNFFEKLGYAMAGGDNIVERSVDIMIETKMPIFINDKFFEITSIIKDGLDNSVYKIKLQDICSSFNKENINAILNSICDNVIQNKNIFEELRKITYYLTVYITKFINKEKINYFIGKFDSEINVLVDKFSSSIVKNNYDICSYLSCIIKDYFVNNFYSLKLNYIFDSYDVKNINMDLNTILDKLKISQYFEDELFLIFRNSLNKMNISRIIHEDIMEQYLVSIYENLLNDIEFKNEISNVSDSFLDSLINDENYEIIDKKSLIYIYDKLIECILSSVINNSVDIIESVNLKQITEKQIKIMNSKELHELFISFSGTLFKKLYLYGSFGAVFGINLWLPVILGLKEIIFKDKNDK